MCYLSVNIPSNYQPIHQGQEQTALELRYFKISVRHHRKRTRQEQKKKKALHNGIFVRSRIYTSPCMMPMSPPPHLSVSLSLLLPFCLPVSMLTTLDIWNEIKNNNMLDIFCSLSSHQYTYTFMTVSLALTHTNILYSDCRITCSDRHHTHTHTKHKHI